MKIQFIFLTVLVSVTNVLSQNNWVVDKGHTDIRFTATHLLISEIDGEFKEFEGKVTTTNDSFEGSEVEFTAEVSSIDTDNKNRDKDLRSDNFFSAENYPELNFKGEIVKEDEKYFLVGDFTIRDVTRSIKFDVKYNGKVNTRRGIKAGFKIIGIINRFDYGLKWDRTIETGGLVVGEEILITCNIELIEVVGSDK